MKRLTVYGDYDMYCFSVAVDGDPNRYCEFSDEDAEFILQAHRDYQKAQEMLEKAKEREVFIPAPFVEPPPPKPYVHHVSREEKKLNWQDLRKMARGYE